MYLSVERQATETRAELSLCLRLNIHCTIVILEMVGVDLAPVGNLSFRDLASPTRLSHHHV